MDSAEIPEVQFEESGVIFTYLVLKFSCGDGEKVLVRGVNYKPYGPDPVQRIVNWTWDQLEAAGYREGRDELLLDGGGTLSVNPYYETAALFGAAPGVGPESDRTATARLISQAYPGYQVEHFAPEEEKPKKAAKKPSAKAAEESPEDAAEAEA